MENTIKGKVIAITGASSGIGAAMARMLTANGAKVVLGARRADRLVGLVAQIKEDGGEAIWMEVDVKQRHDLIRFVELASTEYGGLDVMINNAGISHLARIDELDVADWEDMIDVNLRGTLYGIAAALSVFKKQGNGHIINVISTSGIKIVPLQGVYAGTKNAVRTISEALRQESAGRYRITGISPGIVRTEFVDGLKNADMKAAIQEKMGDIGISADDIARAALYAISQPDHVDIGEMVIRPTAQD
ncbi:putative short-chain dehydrogenase/oxidoreductase [Pedobacter sp. BAL39]|uniref:SDR family oxidoreductase n=1 Tax=Pedobacter sp. BAL39 TaxID=391596 RepID=UPI0001559252|nr:SDR family oxidoreductase [Pedobacter sp. BAL39]EDM34949.1 putative short-chain dehydrogenase/oxidoreductase [Pedobacter sp. BAL39]